MPTSCPYCRMFGAAQEQGYQLCKKTFTCQERKLKTFFLSGRLQGRKEELPLCLQPPTQKEQTTLPRLRQQTGRHVLTVTCFVSWYLTQIGRERKDLSFLRQKKMDFF